MAVGMSFCLWGMIPFFRGVCLFSTVGGIAVQFFEGMAEGWEDGGEVFGDGFAAAGEGNDDGAPKRPGNGAGNGGGGRLGEAGLHHGLFKPRQAAFKEWKQGLRGGVAGGEPCAAAGKDEIVSLAERQFHDKGTQRLRIVWNHETLLVAERQLGAGVGGHERPAFVRTQPGGSLVGKGNPCQSPMFAACGQRPRPGFDGRERFEQRAYLGMRGIQGKDGGGQEHPARDLEPGDARSVVKAGSHAPVPVAVGKGAGRHAVGRERRGCGGGGQEGKGQDIAFGAGVQAEGVERFGHGNLLYGADGHWVKVAEEKELYIRSGVPSIAAYAPWTEASMAAEGFRHQAGPP